MEKYFEVAEAPSLTQKDFGMVVEIFSLILCKCLFFVVDIKNCKDCCGEIIEMFMEND